MTPLNIWREQLKNDLAIFAPLAKEDRSINQIYGITAAAVLWHVRTARIDLAHKSALREACGDETHLDHLLAAIEGWDSLTPLEAARKLGELERNSKTLREALTTLMGNFIETLFTEEMLQPIISVEGNITGGNIVIGGQQIVAGDLIIQYIRPKTERMCPAPLPEPENFGGRDTHLNNIMTLIKAGKDTAITAVQGLGGIGKTTLARVLAYRLHADKTFRAVLWADITRNPDAVSILSNWVVSFADSSFDVSSFKGDMGQIADAARAHLNGVIAEKCEICEPARVLIVVDDVWDNGLDTARLIKRACPDNATVLITTRSENVAIHLNANIQSLAYLDPDDAADLLKTYLPHFDKEALKRLGKALGGHALALKLAARRILKEKRPGESEADKLIRLTAVYETGLAAGNTFDQLKLEQGEEKEDNLRRSLYLSYDALTSDDKMRFRALGILAYDTGFSAELLSALWEIPLEEVYEAADTLRLLSLLELTAEGYSQHPLLQAYARALMNQTNESDTTFARYAQYVTVQAEQFRILPPEEWEQLTPLLPHIREVGDALTRRFMTVGATDDALKTNIIAFAINITGYILHHTEAQTTPQGTRLRGMDWLEGALSASRAQNDKKSERLFLNNIGLMWSALGEQSKALDFYEQALTLKQAVGDHAGEAATLHNIGGVWFDLGEKRKALDFYEQALPLMRSIGNRAGEASTLSSIGNVWSALGEQSKALDFYEQALTLIRAAGDRAVEASTLSSIGNVWSALGEQSKALDFYEQALTLRRAVGDRAGEAATLNNIGSAWSNLGEQRKALDFYEQALTLSRAVGGRAGEANILNNIGSAWSNLGEQRKALDFYEQALPLSRAVGDRNCEGATLSNIGYVWFTLEEQRKALDFFEQALPLRRAVGDRAGEAATLNNIAMVWSNLGEQRKALDFFEQALPLQRAIGDRKGEANILNNIGGIWYVQGEKRKALDFFEQALPLQRTVGDRNGEAATYYNIGMIYYAFGELDKAIKYIERSVLLREKIEHPNLESNRQTLARLRAQRDGDEQSKKDRFEEIMRELTHLYAEKGENVVREMLSGHMDENTITQIIRLIQQNQEDNKQ